MPVAVECKDHSSSLRDTINIGQLSVLPHHRLSDIEFLVADLLSRYSQSLQGLSPLTPSEKVEQTDRAFTLETGTSLSDRIQGECVLADALKNSSAQGKQYLQHSSNCVRSVCQQVMPLGLGKDSVVSYQVGSHQWRRGELDGGVGSKFLIGVLTEPAQIRISLKGQSSYCVNCHVRQLNINCLKTFSAVIINTINYNCMLIVTVSQAPILTPSLSIHNRHDRKLRTFFGDQTYPRKNFVIIW